jgi:WD40 repeat protein
VIKATKQNDVLLAENRQLKSRLESVERENSLLKKSLFDLSLRLDLAHHRLAQTPQQQQQQQQQQQKQQFSKHLVLDSVLPSGSHTNSSLALDELDTREAASLSNNALVLGSSSASDAAAAALSADAAATGGDSSLSSSLQGTESFADEQPTRARSTTRSNRLQQVQFVCSATLARHAGAVHCAAFAPDGSALASAGFDKSVRVWRADAEWASAVELTGHTLGVADVRWAPLLSQHSDLASSAFDSTVRRWSLRADGSGECLATHALGRRGIVQALAFSRSEPPLLFGGSTSGALLSFDMRVVGKCEPTVLAEGNAMINAVADVDGVLLATGDAMGRVRLWDRRAAAQPLAEGRGGGGGEPISHIAVSDALDRDAGGARLLAVSCYDNSIRVHRASADGVRRTLVTVPGLALRNWPIRATFAMGDGFNLTECARGFAGALVLACGGADNAVSVCEMSDVVRAELSSQFDSGVALAPVQQRLAGHTDRVYSVDVRPHSATMTLASASADGTVRLWTPKTT